MIVLICVVVLGVCIWGEGGGIKKPCLTYGSRDLLLSVDFNTRNKLLTQKLLKQGYRYHKLRKTFSKFYR